MLDRVLIKKFCEQSGYSYTAVYKKCVTGVFTEGKEFFRAPDNHIFISKSGFDKWVASTLESKQGRNLRLKSASRIRAYGGAKQSGSNLQPLI